MSCLFFALTGQSIPTYSCVVHDCIIDFFGPVECYRQVEAEKHLKIPNSMYLNMSDQKLYCVSMSHSSLTSQQVLHNRYGNFVSNIRTTVYPGTTSSNASGKLIETKQRYLLAQTLRLLSVFPSQVYYRVKNV